MFLDHALHQQYGPIVGVAASEADICDAGGFKRITRRRLRLCEKRLASSIHPITPNGLLQHE